MHLIQTEQPIAKALVIRPLATLHRRACGNLQPGSGKFAAIFQRVIIGKTGHDACSLNQSSATEA